MCPVLHHNFALFFLLTLHHILFYTWISSFSITMVDFNSVPFPVLKVKTSQVFWQFTGSYLLFELIQQVVSCDSSPAPVCCSFLSVFLPHIPSGAGEPQWPLSVASLSLLGIPKEYILLLERECHESVTHTVVCHGSAVEGFWNCAELKRREPWKALESLFISWVHHWTLPALEASQLQPVNFFQDPKDPTHVPHNHCKPLSIFSGLTVSASFQGCLYILSRISLHPFRAFSGSFLGFLWIRQI